MNNDKRFRQIAWFEMMRQGAERRREERRMHREERFDERLNERFERARRRLAPDENMPSSDQIRIISAALELLDEAGLNNLSLRKLADKLDLRAPALYWYFKNKEVLIDYMAEAILRKEFQEIHPCTSDEQWQEWLIVLCHRLRKAMMSHRDGARIIAGARLDRTITLMKIFEVSLQSLIHAGIDFQRASLIITTAICFVFGNSIEQQSSPSQEELASVDFQSLHKHYPFMARWVHGSCEKTLMESDDFFDSALRLIICKN